VPIDKLIQRFRNADKSTRLDTLLDASGRLPDLPERLRRDGERDRHRVPECQTPVFLWLERDDGRLRLFAEVPPEAPTVRGFVSLLVRALDGEPVALAADLPADLLHLMGLDEALGMMRTQGLTALVQRVRRGAAELGAR
jgi:cysteine desulfuration protein SufE